MRSLWKRVGWLFGFYYDLTLKALITTAADDIHKYFFHCFSEKIRLDVSSESSARQRIHRKNQVLFSLKVKSKKLKCRLLQFLFSALRVKAVFQSISSHLPEGGRKGKKETMCDRGVAKYPNTSPHTHLLKAQKPVALL